MVDQSTTSGFPSVKFEYVVPPGVEPTDDEKALMKAIDERMKARNRALRKAGQAAIRSSGGSNVALTYKVTMPDGTVIDQGVISDDPEVVRAVTG